MGKLNTAGGTNTTLQTSTSGTAYRVVQNGSGLAVRAESATGNSLLTLANRAAKFALIARNVATANGAGGAIQAVGNKNNAVVATSGRAGSYAVEAQHTAPSGYAVGLRATTPSTQGAGAWGRAISNTGNAVGVLGTSDAPQGTGVAGNAWATGGANIGVWGNSDSTGGTGVFGRAQAGSGATFGMYGLSDSTGGTGVYGEAGAGSGTTYGVRGRAGSQNGFGGHFANVTAGVALYATGTGIARDRAVLQVHNTRVGNGAMSAYITANTNFATAHVRNDGSGEVLYLHNGGTDAAGAGGGDFITAVNNPESDAQFRVLTSGEVRSDVGFNTPAADFAEMLDAEPGLEPGDVLAIGADGRLTRSARPHQESLAGVYSTQPGFVGGKPVDGAQNGHVPLAVMGIVPVKASAENGAISPGDLLTSSATPGHAMRANGDARVGCVIGKALEPIPAGTGRIRMLVVLQ